MKALHKSSLLILWLSCLWPTLHAQVGISVSSHDPDPSAMLDVQSTEKGILIPRLTTAQRQDIDTPGTGLLVFDTNEKSFWFYNGVDWGEVGNARWSDNGNQLYYIQGNIGIGTNIPSAALEVKGELNQPNLEISDKANGGIYRRFGVTPTEGGVEIGTLSNDNLVFVTNDSARIVIKNSSQSGFVGIGTLNPDSQLEVAGTITADQLDVAGAISASQIDFADGSSISSGKGVYTVGAGDFVLTQLGHVIQLITDVSNSDGGTYASTNDYNTEILAPVHLPQGAKVTRVTFFGRDQSSSRNLFIALKRLLIQSSNYGVMSSFTSNNSNGSYEHIDNSIQFETIDNLTYRYCIVVHPTNGNWYANPDLAVHGVRIEYTME